MEEPNFSRPTEIVIVDGILSDFDGTIIDSTDAIVKYWQMVSQDLDVDYKEIIKTAHGRRSIDTLKQYDPTKATWEYVCHMEGLVSKRFGQDAVEIPGARSLLASLETLNAPWAIVTSGTQPLIEGWLGVMKMARPKTLVTAEDVTEGKPGWSWIGFSHLFTTCIIDRKMLTAVEDPECYLLGRQRLQLINLEPGNNDKLVVLEDAPAGIRAGKLANCMVIGLSTSHSIEVLKNAGADWIVRNLESIECFRGEQDGKLMLRISNALVM
ncbi:uncharacterized protein KY384_002083 [Bacidia gigantensis]|uniref:uncharacterized protein n=1 Tax=Bacidia gigantensis TaxID=2732470 RepID=UPI001D0430AA|nr:uncharacterized protein KY384_002083 [Bacidia gigantensis]KAG8533300.1 hypothetical protein KY384_002083 [Bacidia gigantensis]